MTVDQAWSLAITWLGRIILLSLMALIAIWVLARFGVRIPVGNPDHVALAYIAGAYWLARKAG